MARTDYSRDWLASFEALKKVCIDGAYSNMALNEAIPRHRGCRDSFVRNLVKGTIRQTVTLDYIIDELATGGIRKIRQRTLIILRMGLYAVREMDAVPDNAAVSEAVELSRKTARGTDKFINAVLRSYLRRRAEFECAVADSVSNQFAEDDKEEAQVCECVHPTSTDGDIVSDDTAIPEFIAAIEDPVKRLSLTYSMPEPLVAMLADQYPDDLETILEGFNRTPQVVLRVNTLKTTREDLVQALAAQGIRAVAAPESELAVIADGSGIVDSDLYRQGYFSVQSLSSIMAVEALSPHPGSLVLDMCAAPGGKSAMMAEMMENSGSIISCDVHEHRLRLIEAVAGRVGTDIISTRLADGTTLAPEFEGQFDYVLADVPCSGLGDMGIKPEIRLRAGAGSYDELTEIQAAILRNAIRYAKPGGRICYSTCTLNKLENESVVYRVLSNTVNCRFENNSLKCDADIPPVEPCMFSEGDLAEERTARKDAKMRGKALRELSPGENIQGETAIKVRVVEMNTILPYNNLIGFFYCILERTC